MTPIAQTPTIVAMVARAWFFLACALALHVADEALTGFLPVWNATVAGVRSVMPWAPLPSFPFWLWLGGLIAAVLAMLVCTPLVARGVRWTRPVAWFLGIVMVGNAIGHTLGTIFGRTLASVRFARPMPGFYSSPVLLLAAIWLILVLRATARVSPVRVARP